MNKEIYDRMLIKWAEDHYWDSLEKDKDLIFLHLKSFTRTDRGWPCKHLLARPTTCHHAGCCPKHENTQEYAGMAELASKQHRQGFRNGPDSPCERLCNVKGLPLADATIRWDALDGDTEDIAVAGSNPASSNK